jgi:glycosyltransferase involved in cell wall biosynthesis
MTLRILTWHVHGSYLYYLAHVPHELVVPVRPDRPDGYGGRTDGYPWPSNVVEVPADEVRRERLDCVLFQSRRNWEEDQFEILSDEQRRLPRIYLEHDPPRESPTDTRHHVDDPDVLVVHCTAFNDLMWDSGRSPTRVIDHGVVEPRGVAWTGELDRGIVVVNGIGWRGRRLGADVFERARQEVPLDLVGLESEKSGGLGPLTHADLPPFEARYRFFFNPIRYTSLGLSIIEAMMVGMPIVALATTEIPTIIQNGVSGVTSTSVDDLIDGMRRLLTAPDEARRLGEAGQRVARERFSIDRFARDWDETFRFAVGRRGLTQGVELAASTGVPA